MFCWKFLVLHLLSCKLLNWGRYFLTKTEWLSFVHLFNTFFSIFEKMINFTRFQLLLDTFNVPFVFSFENRFKFFTYFIFLLLPFIFLLISSRLIFVKGVQHLLIFLLLTHPKQMFVEVIKNFKRSSD